MNRKKVLTFVVVLSVVFVIGCLLLDSFLTKNLKAGEAEAAEILDSLENIGIFHWNSSEYKLIAVIFCKEEKIFVERSSKGFSEEILGCQYVTAYDIFPIASGDPWDGDPKIYFVPIVR